MKIKAINSRHAQRFEIDFIVTGDSMGPAKKEKAEKLGVKMITEDEFAGMLEK